MMSNVACSQCRCGWQLHQYPSQTSWHLLLVALQHTGSGHQDEHFWEWRWIMGVILSNNKFSIFNFYIYPNPYKTGVYLITVIKYKILDPKRRANPLFSCHTPSTLVLTWTIINHFCFFDKLENMLYISIREILPIDMVRLFCVG